LTEIRGHYLSQPQDLARIITPKHRERLEAMLREVQNTDARIVSFDQVAATQMAPTLVLEPSLQSRLMSEEIFGPILPILGYEHRKEVISYINSHPKPLALYIFSSDRTATQEILNNTSSGGVCINDTVIHLANHHLPFGGIGASGMGNYHGYHGFKAFSHERAVMQQSPWNKMLELFYPPYSSFKIKILKWMIKYL